MEKEKKKVVAVIGKGGKCLDFHCIFPMLLNSIKCKKREKGGKTVTFS